MRVLIYGEGLEADAILQAEREAGNHASLRNPAKDLFEIDPPEPCDAIHCWETFIWHAYVDKAEIHYHGHLATEEEAAAYDEPVKPKRKRK